MRLCELCGADTASGFRLRETCTLLTPEALLDIEIYDIVRFEAAGIDTSRETLALDVIKAVGPKGHYLNQPHTHKYMHKLEFSEFSLQQKQDNNYLDAIQLARRKTEWILNNHHPEPLSEAQRAEFERILQAADSELN